jgi:AraC-like DNA-binding protein
MRASEVPTVHLSQLIILMRHLERRGFDLKAWREEVACPELANGDPDARVAIGTMERAWRASLALTRSPALALEVGGDHTCLAHSIIGHLIAHSDTLGDALRGLCRYFVFMSGGMTIALESTEETARLVAATEDPNPDMWPSVAARSLAAAFTIAHDETGGAFALQRTDWNHPAPAHRSAYEQFFKTRCVFGEKACQLVFDSSMLKLPMMHRNPGLQPFLRQRLDLGTAALIAPSSTREALRQKLPQLLDRGELSAGEAANALNLSLRSLHRALANEKTTFQREIDAVRRERCLLLMETGEQPLEHIAFACGFADASGFHRAFRRWTGKSPSDYRDSKTGDKADR